MRAVPLIRTAAIAVHATKKRVRAHVNPLASSTLGPLDRLRSSIWTDPARRMLPVHLDLGCGGGRFLMDVAANASAWNCLGLEIRRPLVEKINLRTDLPTNLEFLHGNATATNLRQLKTQIVGPIMYVTIQFSDPWISKRHHKRRMVSDVYPLPLVHFQITPPVVNALAEVMAPDGFVFIQSDVAELLGSFANHFKDTPMYRECDSSWPAHHPGFPVGGNPARYQHAMQRYAQQLSPSSVDDEHSALPVLPEHKVWSERPNPVGIPTERETICVQLQHRPIYRALFQRR